MNLDLTIVWQSYPAHSTKGLILKRPLDIIETHPERRASLLPLRDGILKMYGATIRG